MFPNLPPACWLLIVYCCCWLLLTDYCCCADYFHLRQSPLFQLSYCWLTPTRDCIKSQYFLEISISESFPKRMIEKYRSCLVFIMHLRGGNTFLFGIFGNTSYGCLLLRFLTFPLTSIHCFWHCVGPLFVFLYFFRCEWVFAGICFWYFPLPAGALDLRPWPFCRPGRKLTGPGTDPGMHNPKQLEKCPLIFGYILFIVLFWQHWS